MELQPGRTPDSPRKGDQRVHAMMTSSGASQVARRCFGSSGDTKAFSDVDRVCFLVSCSNAAKIHNVNSVVNTDG